MDPYKDFTTRFSLFAAKYPEIITLTLSNIFTMRLIGNKTHGDLAEIAIAEFINQYMYDFSSIHVGKDLYRAKSREEDITIKNEVTGSEFPVSLKAYGDGPLQLSTDKDFRMFPLLSTYGDLIDDPGHIAEIFSSDEFSYFSDINVLPLIYDEKRQRCNILVFDSEKAKLATKYIHKASAGHGRKHPAYRFYDKDEQYICEVRYGNAAANALQRGLWTHTKNALPFFESVTNGWIRYEHNKTLVQLLSHALVSGENGHAAALDIVKQDIQQIKSASRVNAN